MCFSCNNNTHKEKKDICIEKIKPEEIHHEEETSIYGFETKNYHVINGRIKKGQTFGKILFEHNIDFPTIDVIVAASKEEFDVRKIQRNRKYTLLCKKDSLHTAQIFIYEITTLDYVVFDFRDSIHTYKCLKNITYKEREVFGIINSSLAETLEKQNIDYRVLNKVSEIYAWTIDFFRLQKGDYFKLIYNERYIDDSVYIGIEAIKAAEFHNNGQTFFSFYYNKGKYPEYYDEKGKNLRKAFLKAPLKFGTFRISSRFSRKRFHPVQHRWKAHLGTDYAAPRGTPIIATANGTVVKSSYTRANGKYVKIRHNSTYSTQYLHMSRRAVRVGQTVKQGQTIGYVGMTGLATGPHVCYRFWKNGRQVNSLRQKLPDSKPIDPSEKEKFLTEMLPLKKQLDNIILNVEPHFIQNDNDNEFILKSNQ